MSLKHVCLIISVLEKFLKWNWLGAHAYHKFTCSVTNILFTHAYSCFIVYLRMHIHVLLFTYLRMHIYVTIVYLFDMYIYVLLYTYACIFMTCPGLQKPHWLPLYWARRLGMALSLVESIPSMVVISHPSQENKGTRHYRKINARLCNGHFHMNDSVNFYQSIVIKWWE